MPKQKNKVDFAKIKDNIARKRLRKDDNSNDTIYDIDILKLGKHFNLK